MIKPVRHLSALMFLLLFALPSLRAEPLIIYTENYPPLNYLNENGELVGLATKNVRQVLDKTDLEYQFRVVPWHRAYVRAKQSRNALIFTIIRTPKREADFDWLFPLAGSDFHVYARTDENREVTPETIKAGVFTGACVKDDLSCELFETIGMPKQNIRQVAGKVAGDFLMVKAGRADLYISETRVNAALRANEGNVLGLTKPVMPIEVGSGFYLASGLNVPAEVRQRIRVAYQQLVMEGLYEPMEVSR